MRSGPIILVEDDQTDKDFIYQALDELGIENKRVWLRNGAEALDYLCTTNDNPFIIICDINLPRINGTELRTAINQDEYLRRKSIPFVFLCTSPNRTAINRAYDETVQGFFTKGNTFPELKRKLHLMISYWQECIHPNTSQA